MIKCIVRFDNQTINRNLIIKSGNAISMIVELSETSETIDNIIYACSGNLHDDRCVFYKELGNGIVDLGNNKYKVLVDSIDTQNMIQGIYNHNLRVTTSIGSSTILGGLIFVESEIGSVDYLSQKPITLNYNSYIDGTIEEALILDANVIPSNMFYGCRFLKSVYLSPTISEINQEAFEDCSVLDLKVLPINLTKIGYKAFGNCTGLTEIRFMKKPTNINSLAFTGCTNLIDIYVPWAEGEVANAPWGATNATIHYNS